MCVASNALLSTPRWKAWAVLLFLYLPAWREFLMPQCLRLPWPEALYFWVALPSRCCEHDISGRDIPLIWQKHTLGLKGELIRYPKGQLHMENILTPSLENTE